MGATRLAVVGTKGIGREHIKAIAAVPDCELIAVVDVNVEEAEACSAQHNVPCYSDVEQMLSKERLDGICICTPHWFHPGIASKAFQAGLHVLTEKPMAVTVEDAEKMIEASHKHSRTLAVVFQHRTMPVNMKAREIVEAGRIGEIRRTLLVAPWLRSDAYYRDAGWRGSWKGEGGGVLLNQAPHSLDLFLWISGLMPNRLIGQAETVGHKIEVEDRASALLHYESGATGYMHASTVESPSDVRMEFAGDNGKLVVTDKLMLYTQEQSTKEYIETSDEVWDPPEGKWEEIEFALPEGTREGHERVIEDFVEAIGSGRKPIVSGEEGLGSLEIANAVTLSSQRNESIDIPIPRKAYSELVSLLAGRTARRRRRGTSRTKRLH